MESEESGEELEMERSVANRENETSSRNNQSGNNSSKNMSNDNNDEDEKDDDGNITNGGTANNNNNGNPRIIFEQSIPLSQFLLMHLLMNRAPSAEEEKQKLRRSLNYLKNLDKTSEEIVLDEQAIQSLIDIYDLTRKNNDYIPIVIEFKIQLLLKELFEYIYKCLKEYVEKNEIDIELENTNPKFTTFHLICDFAEILVTSSKEFAALFHMVGGSKCFLVYFNDRRLIAYLSKSMTRSDEYKNRRKMNYNKALSAMLNALFYLKNNRTQPFKELNAIEIITQFCNELTLDNCELILRAHFILAMLASRAQIERLGNIDFTILILEKTVQMFAEASQKNTKYSSYQFELFYDNDVRSFEISVLNSPKEFIITIMSIIEAFIVNDEIKYRIYATIRNSLYILFTQGDAIEKYFSLSLLIDFAFDDVLNEKLSQLTHLTATIDQILMQASQIDELIVSHVSCFKSLLNIRQIVKDYKVVNSVSMPALPRSFSSMSGQRTRLESTFSSSREEEQSNVIAISYSDVNELSAMKLRYALENLDFDARLVVNKSLSTQKYDVNLAIKSIKECGLLIMCLSSSYEGDKLCQFEAELAIRLGKPYVTVNVQNRYAPDYWLETVAEKHKVLQFGLATARGDIEAVAEEIESTLEAHRQARERHRLSRMNGVRTSRLSNREQMPTPRESNETIDQEPFQPPPQQQPPPPPPISRHSSAQSRPRRPTNDHNATPPRSAAKPRATPPSNSSVCAIL